MPNSGSAELRVKPPRVSVLPASGDIVPELTETFPVTVPIPLKVPLCALKPLSLQTEIDALSITPFTLKFALLIVNVLLDNQLFHCKPPFHFR